MVGSDFIHEKIMVRCDDVLRFRACITFFDQQKIMNASWLIRLTVTVFQTFGGRNPCICSREEEFNDLLACDAELVFQHRKSLSDGFRPCTILDSLTSKLLGSLPQKKTRPPLLVASQHVAWVKSADALTKPPVSLS